jgi:hypothetical protein
MSGPFDRLPSRWDGAAGARSVSGGGADPDGRRVLFSHDVSPAKPPLAGTVTVDCSACQEVTVLTTRQAVRAALPSLHLPLLKRNHPSWMRCPACGRHTWVRATVRW